MKFLKKNYSFGEAFLRRRLILPKAGLRLRLRLRLRREAINFSFFAKCYGYVDLYKSSFFLPFILSQIDLVQESLCDSSIKQIFSGILIISVVGLFCFINIVYFMTGYILITRGNYEEKYPRLKRIIQYYKTTNLIFIFIEVILCFTCLLLITIFSLLFVIK